MVVAQELKEPEITEHDSLLLTLNMLRIAVFDITFIRGLFPEKYFNDKSVPALEMKIKKLMPMDAESRRLIDWMETGVYDALQKKYLKTLLFCVYETIEGPLIEEYAFSFSYSDPGSQEVSMNINRRGSKKQGATFKSHDTDDTPSQMKSSACKMVRTLIQLMRTLDKIPEERTIVMKLLYYDDITPIDYEPPYFRSCSEQEANRSWTKRPLKMEVGNVNSKHFVLSLKVKSILDPCDGEEDGLQGDDEVSLGADSVRSDDSSDSDSEDNSSSGEDNYIVSVAVKEHSSGEDRMVEEEDTQDEEEDTHQLSRVRDWISSHPTDTVGLSDVCSKFQDISTTLIEEIMENLIGEGILSRTGRDIYTIREQKNFESHVGDVKDDLDAQVTLDGKVQKEPDVDYLYMKALYHALPMEYVTVGKLQTKLEGEVKHTTVRKLINKMAQDGYLEETSNRRLGKRVVHSELSNRKLLEIKKTLENNSSAMEICALQNRPNSQSILKTGITPRNTSTCGGLHSIGSDFTRMGGRSVIQQMGSVRSEQPTGIKREQGFTPTSKLEPVPTRESNVSGNEHGQANGRRHYNDGESTIFSRSTQNKRARKASTVQEPIVQYQKQVQEPIVQYQKRQRENSSKVEMQSVEEMVGEPMNRQEVWNDLGKGTTTGVILCRGIIYCMADGRLTDPKYKITDSDYAKLSLLGGQYMMTKSGTIGNIDIIERRLKRGLIPRTGDVNESIKKTQKYISRWEKRHPKKKYPALVGVNGFYQGGPLLEVVGGTEEDAWYIHRENEINVAVFTGSGAVYAIERFSEVMEGKGIDDELNVIKLLKGCLTMAGIKDEFTGGFYSLGEIRQGQTPPMIEEERPHLIDLICEIHSDLMQELKLSVLIVTQNFEYAIETECRFRSFLKKKFKGIDSIKSLAIQTTGDYKHVRMITFDGKKSQNRAWSLYSKGKEGSARVGHKRGRIDGSAIPLVKFIMVSPSLYSFKNMAQDFKKDSL